MEKIKLKIREFDAISNSLIVSFGDETTSNEKLDASMALAYQPTMFPDIIDNPQEILKRIAFSGISVIEQQKIKETFIADTNKINAFKSLIGQSFEFLVSELTSSIVDPNQ